MTRAGHHGPFGKKILIPNGPDPCGRSGVRFGTRAERDAVLDARRVCDVHDGLGV